MIAYNNKWLNNLLVHENAEQAFNEQCITAQENQQILAAYPVGFYSPNIFVRIGLSILTVVIALFSFGLLSLIFLSVIEKNFGVLLIVFGCIAYVALEMMVSKNHYKSGVDDALLWIAPVCIVSGLNVMSNISWLTNCIIILVLALILFIRYTNSLVAAVAAIASIGSVFFAFMELGDIAKATAPFAIMLASAVIYFVVKRMQSAREYKLYRDGLLMISFVTLLCFCIACNYFVVRETSIAMFDLTLSQGQSIPFGWLFWILTVLVPLSYIVRGIQVKDRIILRTGLLLIALVVFTVRYYYHLLPIETVAVVAGILLITLAWALIRYLKEPKFSFTYQKATDAAFGDKLQIESLIIAETFAATTQPADTGMQFGGGSGGGAGSSGEY